MISQNYTKAQARWLKEREVAEITGISLSTLRKHRARQLGIRFTKVGRSVLYSLEDVVAFMKAHVVEARR